MTVALRGIGEQRRWMSGDAAAPAIAGLPIGHDLGSTIGAVAGAALERFRCDAAAVVVATGQDVGAEAGTHAEAVRSGELQVEWGEGPTLDAVVGRRSSVVHDLRVESRWRFWAPQAAQLGWRSVMTVGLWYEDTRVALSLYSRQPYSFMAYDLAAATAFGHRAAPAVRLFCHQTMQERAVSA